MRLDRFAISLLLLLPLLARGAQEARRPKIGLALGGGGALGLAHIGVLKELERQHIPIDYIGGTSMGAVVAGMYASGMSPEEIEQRFLTLDWWDVLKDRPRYNYLDYRRKLDHRRFMGLEFGLKHWRLVFPPGVVYGQKLNNVLEGFTLNSAGITNFNNLNIPFRAVATDLPSGKSVVLKSGNLPQALRASMAVPGAFTPVRIGKMVLIDGGILDNIPVDVIRSMGADIVIAVDVGAVSAEAKAKGDFNSLSEVVTRTYSLMQRPEQERQLAHADVVISPPLAEFSSAQFQLAKSIIPVGQETAREQEKKLAALRVAPAEYQAYLKRQRRRRTDKINIGSIEVTGNKVTSETVIRERIRTKKGPLEIKSVGDDLNRIYGMGDFQTVIADIVPTNGSDTLIYQTTEKFWGPNYLHFGARAEFTSASPTFWGILLNYTRSQLNRLGGEIQIDLQGGGKRWLAKGEWYQPVSWGERVFVAPSLAYDSKEIPYYDDDTEIAKIDQSFAYGKLDLGLSFFEYGEFRAGLFGGRMNIDRNGVPSGIPGEDDTVAGGMASLNLDQLDAPVFPTRGYQLGIDALFAMDDMGSSKNFDRVELHSQIPLSFGRHTVIPKLALGTSLGSELPLYARFDIGGIDSFGGYAPYQKRGNHYGVGSIAYRYRIARLPPTFGNGIFALARVDAGNAWESGGDARLDNIDYGALVGIGADTIIGACKLAVGKAEGFSTRFYFLIGNQF